MITKKSDNINVNSNNSNRNFLYGWAVRDLEYDLIIYNEKQKPYKTNNGGWTGDRIIYKGPNKDPELIVKHSDPPVLVKLIIKPVK